jgi:antitoxin component of MazEF toxin-antitoxin module
MIQVHMDSGSSVIVLPETIFVRLFYEIQDKVSVKCKCERELIHCPKYTLDRFVGEGFGMNVSVLQK